MGDLGGDSSFQAVIRAVLASAIRPSATPRSFWSNFFCSSTACLRATSHIATSDVSQRHQPPSTCLLA